MNIVQIYTERIIYAKSILMYAIRQSLSRYSIFCQPEEEYIFGRVDWWLPAPGSPFSAGLENISMHFALTADRHYPTLDALRGMLEAIGFPADTADLATNFPSMLPCNGTAIAIDTFNNFTNPDFKMPSRTVINIDENLPCDKQSGRYW